MGKIAQTVTKSNTELLADLNRMLAPFKMRACYDDTDSIRVSDENGWFIQIPMLWRLIISKEDEPLFPETVLRHVLRMRFGGMSSRLIKAFYDVR